MALRAVLDHPKLFALKTTLKCPRYVALGCLESLWHFAGRYTPRGDIGKYADSAIEAWIEWNGKPGALMAALIQTGWVDESPEHRLLVHDWSEHADKATKNSVQRSGQTFYYQSVRTEVRSVRTEVHSCTDFVGLPEPVPEPEPVPVKAQAPVVRTEEIPEWLDVDLWEGWLQMRRKIRNAPFTDRARKSTLSDLAKLREWGIDPNERLEKGIKSGWRGVLFDSDKPTLQKRDPLARMNFANGKVVQ